MLFYANLICYHAKKQIGILQRNFEKFLTLIIFAIITLTSELTDYIVPQELDLP